MGCFKKHLDVGRQTVVPFFLCTACHPRYKGGQGSEVVHVNSDTPSRSVVFGLLGKEEAGRRIYSARLGAVGETLFC